MKVLVEGTEEEIERVKIALSASCLFSNEFCETGIQCIDCEKKQGLEIDFIVKEEKK